MKPVYKSRTLWFYLLSLVSALLGWEYITHFLNEQTVALLLSGVGILLRFATTTPVGVKE